MKKIITLFLLILAVKLCITTTNVINIPKGACECGAFDKNVIGMNDMPILQQRPMNVTCDDEGSEVCQKLCSALAEASRARGPTLLCASILNVDDLIVSVYARSCNEDLWTYTNLTSPDPICCRDGEPIIC